MVFDPADAIPGMGKPDMLDSDLFERLGEEEEGAGDPTFRSRSEDAEGGTERRITRLRVSLAGRK